MEYVSQEGLEKLKQELEHLKTTRRKEIAARLEHAKTLGDLSENAEYQEAKEEQSLIESQITELEETIRNAVLIKKDRISDTVDVGSTIRVRSGEGEETYTIVGSEEASPAQGKISNESPLGKAFLGHRAGDTVEVKTPGGMTTYEILGIQ
ncbi:MAG: transcription elongation factor GreA [Candidatus Sungiibacteriota bacterium]|uniref:Transcription elongation factor GreA n=1 Tax=Candidatus Sungiibacteriota bacterium TaxID=2750080 RepID=A0A7T5RJA1_9BACT|nr:MAG: transcription elongation factor GreA [Candidatus Sungbacteria bacterium]